MSAPDQVRAPDSATPGGHEEPWRRLDPRMILVRPAVDIIRSLPLLIGTLIFGGQNSVWQWLGLGVVGLAVLISIGHCLTARYRITGEQFELRTGIVHRRHRAVPRDRIRTVDVTAALKHRLFGLSLVKIGTGQHSKDGSGELVLDAVSKAEAQRLARVLLRRAEAESRAETEEVLAEAEPRWVRYAPASLSGITTIGAGIGVLYHAAHDLHIEPSDFGPLRALIAHFEAAPWGLALAEAVLPLLLLAALVSVPGYLVSYGNFRLTRDEDTLHVRRGLLTTRAVSIEQNRLRGVHYRDGVALRLLGGARATAIASGLATRLGGAILMPPAPAAHVHEVLAKVLREEQDPTALPLRPHPRRALRRRLLRAFTGPLLAAAALYLIALTGWIPSWTWQLALVLLPFSLAAGWDCYRNLGNRLDGGYLLGRKGSLRRETVALKQDGIIGWQLDRTFFQRRAGLTTLIATIAAGHGAYSIPDLAESDALTLADEAIPGLLSPFLEWD
ncbi:putative membrane protein [Amycolatopsis xylanica]|uniref:Putative membrane protein n=1 Tax=Amycolatopsis xylanica TaxID=589385 RepID=A0A1H2VQR0_9PSEU|nr:PH domain-containing protein [Amycolatopsis xylanica]SDW70620.1 putative membrane protein [Amycolatopsis xylanica]